MARCRQFTPAEEDCHTTLKVDVVVVGMARTPYLELIPTLLLFIQKKHPLACSNSKLETSLAFSSPRQRGEVTDLSSEIIPPVVLSRI